MTSLPGQNLVPETAIAQLEALAQLLQQTLETSLLGLILHGSAASAGFEVERSDLDVLAIIDGQLTRMQRESIGKGMLSISNEPHPLEFSVVAKRDLDNWSHPCIHQFHYGEDKREQFSEGSYIIERFWRDPDLATNGVDSLDYLHGVSESIFNSRPWCCGYKIPSYSSL